MSKANEYQIKVRDEGVYLCKMVQSLDDKGQMSQDHRLLTDNEIVKAFYWYLLKYCKDNRTQKYRLYNGRKLLFEARKARR
jgi:hypothetical protein